MSYFFPVTAELVAPLENQSRGSCYTCYTGTARPEANEARSNVANVASPAALPFDWCGFFEERAAIRQHDGGLSRADAEAGALDDCVARWRALDPLPASDDDASAYCGSARPDTPVLADEGDDAHARAAVLAALNQGVAGSCERTGAAGG